MDAFLRVANQKAFEESVKPLMANGMTAKQAVTTLKAR